MVFPWYKYDFIFMDREPFDEVKTLLFKSLETGPCVWCKTPTQYLDYTFQNIPISLCSDTCHNDILKMLEKVKEDEQKYS